jgi:hypothetical protein
MGAMGVWRPERSAQSGGRVWVVGVWEGGWDAGTAGQQGLECRPRGNNVLTNTRHSARRAELCHETHTHLCIAAN